MKGDWAPLGWLARAWRVPGAERRSVVQAAKAAAAAVGAWLLATEVFQWPQPFLAPYAAVFLVQTTVYRSVRDWLQQVGAVTAGVGLAALAGQFVPRQAVALGAVVFLGLLLGSWRWFGASGIWVGVTAMLVVSYGTATQGFLLWDRLAETAMGAALGAVVNALVFPPLYGERLSGAVDRLAEAIAELLDDTAELVLLDEPPEDVDDWLGRVRDVRSQVVVAEDALGLTHEGRRLNLRRRGTEAMACYERPLRTLLGLWRPLDHLAAAVRTAATAGEPFSYPGPAARQRFSELLHGLADAVRTVVARDESRLGHCRELLSEIDRWLMTPEGERAAALGLGAMALPVRHLLERLEAGRRAG
ncbi:aromatic acid exporter family protein [Amycolatopsis sp. NPDC059021]|uniref:FUSC family protein n=1 Tax=Amycolatopsis sp. NPDC059021 TaxID=3346704 RepID=UPI0036725A34